MADQPIDPRESDDKGNEGQKPAISPTTGKKESDVDLHLNGDTTLQTPEEDRDDKSNDQQASDKMEVS